MIVENSSPFAASHLSSLAAAISSESAISEALPLDSNNKLTVPSTMEEIYRLSNMNRMRNKEKKKLKEGRSDSYDSDDEE